MSGDGFPLNHAAPVLCAGVLIGGQSSRMGNPKHLLAWRGRTLLESCLAALYEVEELYQARPQSTAQKFGKHHFSIYIIGAGELPEEVAHGARIDDLPELSGPLSGVLAARRLHPDSAWVFIACDHPWISRDAIRWLIAQRDNRHWTIIPRQCDGHPCPTFALYEPPALRWLEACFADEGRKGLASLLDHPLTLTPYPPAELAQAWRSANTPAELAAESERKQD